MSDVITKAVKGSNAIVPAMHDGELRILDTDLATRLGFAKPTKIRDLIKRHVGSLEKMGPLPTVGRVINGGNATEHYLNEEQALFITAKSETTAATKITIEIVTQFAAFKRGEVAAPAVPTSFREALLLAADQQERIEAQERELAIITPKAAAHDYLAELPGDLGVRDAGRELKVGQQWVTDYIDGHGWSCVEGGKRKPAHYGLKHGYCRFVRKTYPHPHTGEEIVREDFRLTGKGIARLAEIIATMKAQNEAKTGLRNLAEKVGKPPFAKKPEPVS
ncbi:phage antirepressor KilAC domain-containing protein [Gluconobacter sp. Dm-74]|uniref:phage antirepressor KilAC domain-containing protein n=1 Tax=Gluconobacter sp. Dm-74 TaxID=2799803 RepID=UPI001B8CC7D7|nr:phage antirepressor KilAC domain-containing protein [Gluconobacter sp. Dm-74]MBS1091049.1 phage antirepressor KilAC domain-containing protein [Gluconobacter sp. Dm-74]